MHTEKHLQHDWQLFRARGRVHVILEPSIEDLDLFSEETARNELTWRLILNERIHASIF